MTVLTMSAEGGSDGLTVTTGNSGGDSGDAFDAVTAGALVFEADAAVHGALGLRVVPSSGSIREGRWDFTADGTAHFVGYFARRAAPTATHTLVQLRNASGNAAVLAISSSTTRILVQNAAGATVFGVAATATTQDVFYRLELQVAKGTTTGDGTIKFAMYEGDSTTPISGAEFDSSTENTGTADLTNMRIGRPSGTTTDVTTEDWDSFRLFTAADVPATMSNPWPAEPSDVSKMMWNGSLWVPTAPWLQYDGAVFA